MPVPIEGIDNPSVTANDKGGKTPSGDSTPPAEGEESNKGGNNDSDQNKNDALVPSYRLKEEAEKRRDAEARLAEYEKKEKDMLEKKKKAEEADALKKGEHEKIIAQKDEEISSFKEKEKEREKRSEAITKIAENKLELFKEKYGEEALAKCKKLMDSDDPWVIIEKIDDYADIFSEKPTGGSRIPQPGSNDNKLEMYKQRLEKGERLSALEQSEYMSLLSKLD